MSHILISFNGFWLLLMLFETDHKIGIFQASKIWSKTWFSAYMDIDSYQHLSEFTLINPKFNIGGPTSNCTCCECECLLTFLNLYQLLQCNSNNRGFMLLPDGISCWGVLCFGYVEDVWNKAEMGMEFHKQQFHFGVSCIHCLRMKMAKWTWQNG